MTSNISDLLTAIRQSKHTCTFVFEVVNSDTCNHYTLVDKDHVQYFELLPVDFEGGLSFMEHIDRARIEDVIANYSLGFKSEGWNMHERRLYALLESCQLRDDTFSYSSCENGKIKFLIERLNATFQKNERAGDLRFSVHSANEDVLELGICDTQLSIPFSDFEDRIYRLPVRLFSKALKLSIHHNKEEDEIEITEELHGGNITLEIGLANHIQIGLNSYAIASNLRLN